MQARSCELTIRRKPLTRVGLNAGRCPPQINRSEVHKERCDDQDELDRKRTGRCHICILSCTADGKHGDIAAGEGDSANSWWRSDELLWLRMWRCSSRGSRSSPCTVSADLRHLPGRRPSSRQEGCVFEALRKHPKWVWSLVASAIGAGLRPSVGRERMWNGRLCQFASTCGTDGRNARLLRRLRRTLSRGQFFFSACNGHDRCWGSAGNRSVFDLAFRDNLVTACGSVAGTSGYNICLGFAGLYHGAVSTTTPSNNAYANSVAQFNCAAWNYDMNNNGCSR